MEILDKIYTLDKNSALKDILKLYKEKGFLIINYIYFANLVINGIIGNKKLNLDYKKSLLNCDFLLPDGIALSIFYKNKTKKSLNNLNGTDFIDYFLSNLDKKNLNLILYGGKKDVIKKASEYIFKKYNINPFYFQDGYSDFDFSMINKLDKNKINILLLGLGTPLQEVWRNNNIEKIKKYNLIVFSQGGTFDFWAGKDKRAPKILQKIKLEWFWRLLTNPKKNFKKVFYSFYLFLYIFKK